jgi:hypothetical protein
VLEHHVEYPAAVGSRKGRRGRINAARKGIYVPSCYSATEAQLVRGGPRWEANFSTALSHAVGGLT